MIAPSELILNSDGSIYHLGLKPEQVSDKVVIVGDPGRVAEVSSRFSSKEFEIQNREFFSCTGMFRGKRITVASTGIGTDNVDIFMNELDALVNIDLSSRTVKIQKKSLSIVRIGTSGALQEDIPVDSFVVSQFGMGLDVLMNYYRGARSVHDSGLQQQFLLQFEWPDMLHKPLFFEADESLYQLIGGDMPGGITATAPGFYAPQGRQLRLKPIIMEIEENLGKMKFYSLSCGDTRITNFEMETSALYGLSLLMGHKACTVCAIVANRIRKEYSKDHKKCTAGLIDLVLERI